MVETHASPPAAESEPPLRDTVPARRRWSSERKLVLVAMLAVTVFVFLYARSLAHQRSPEARLDEVRPAVGAQFLGQPFSPAVHDRELEAAPWASRSGQAGSLRISEYLEGKTVFLNFWATWCEPCVRELPSMLRLAQAMQRRDFVMIAVSYDESWNDVGAFFEQHLKSLPPNFVLARDPGLAADPLRAHYGTEKLPETYVIQNGVIIDRFISAHDWSANDKLEYFDLLLEVGGGR